VPLDAKYEVMCVFYALDDTVFIISIDMEVLTKIFDGLMMQSVRFDMMDLKNSKEKSMRFDGDGVDKERRVGMIIDKIMNMRIECATEIDVDKLHTATYTEDR